MSDDTFDEWVTLFEQGFLFWPIRIASTQSFHKRKSNWKHTYIRPIEYSLHLCYILLTWRLMKPPSSKINTRFVQYSTLRINRWGSRMYTLNLIRSNGTTLFSSREMWKGCSLFQQRFLEIGFQKTSVATINLVLVRAKNVNSLNNHNKICAICSQPSCTWRIPFPLRFTWAKVLSTNMVSSKLRYSVCNRSAILFILLGLKVVDSAS